MTELAAKVEWYMGRDVDFGGEVRLRDEGQGEGAYIHEWNIIDKSLPTAEELQVAGDEYEAHIAATQYIKNREDAMHDLLPESMYMPAMLEQAKADRGGGKTLEPGLEEAVNIYDQIMIDNPEP